MKVGPGIDGHDVREEAEIARGGPDMIVCDMILTLCYTH